MHPLVSFASRNQPPTLTGTAFICHGDDEALQSVQSLTDSLGAHFIASDVHGSSYHATAALVANGSAALAASTLPLLERLGVTRRRKRYAAALLHSVAANIRPWGFPPRLLDRSPEAIFIRSFGTAMPSPMQTLPTRDL